MVKTADQRVRSQINWVSGKDLNRKKARRQHEQRQRDRKLEKKIKVSYSGIFDNSMLNVGKIKCDLRWAE